MNEFSIGQVYYDGRSWNRKPSKNNSFDIDRKLYLQTMNVSF